MLNRFATILGIAACAAAAISFNPSARDIALAMASMRCMTVNGQFTHVDDTVVCTEDRRRNHPAAPHVIFLEPLPR